MEFDRRHFMLGTLGTFIPASLQAADIFPFAERLADDTLAIEDDLGSRIVLRLPVTRLVVFNRYTAEFVRALSGSDVMVGIGADTTKDSTYWPNLQAAIMGSGQTHPNYEAIIATQPDCVLFPRNSEWEAARRLLAPFNIPVLVITAWDILKHEANISMLGLLLQKETRAAELNAFYRHYRDLLKERTSGLTRKRVYFEEVGNYKTVLKGSGWHDMIEMAGGVNIFGDLASSDQRAARGNVQSFDVDPEEIAARKPDIIVKLQPNQYSPHTKAFSTDVLNALAMRSCCANLPLVAAGQIYHISYFLAGGCSKITGALQVAKWLYPDAFADIDPGDAMRVWLEHYQSVPYPGGYWISLAQIRQ